MRLRGSATTARKPAPQGLRARATGRVKVIKSLQIIRFRAHPPIQDFHLTIFCFSFSSQIVGPGGRIVKRHVSLYDFSFAFSSLAVGPGGQIVKWKSCSKKN